MFSKLFRCRPVFQHLPMCPCLTNKAGLSDLVKIPKRKQRNATDILQTLASTVGRDPTAAHYKYHDDPYLIPLSNVGKRTFAMAQEAGRKAAKWIVNENAHLFNHSNAQPPIQAFTPKRVYDDANQVDEDTLLQAIRDGLVGDALTIYELLGKEISDAAKQPLLELICYTNEEEGIPDELVEERWHAHSQNKKNNDTVTKTWKDGGVADSIFKSLQSPSAAAYSAIIQGQAKFGQVDKAWQNYDASREKGLILDVGAYNALISIVNVLRQGEQRVLLLQDLLARMVVEKISPDLATLNSALLTISNWGNGSFDQALSCLAEFRSLGIQPSLGTYSVLLQTIRKDRNAAINIGKVISDILATLEGRALEIQHPLDTRFFARAMEVCRYGAQDVSLAYRLDAILHHADNYNLIGDSYDESIYYRHFFMLLCSSETMDKIMQVYDDLVPNVYTPEPAVMQELLKTADLSGELELLPRFWTDMVAFDHSDREQLLVQLLESLVRNEPPPGSALINTFDEIGGKIWEKIETQPANRVNVLSWSGDMLSHILLLAVRNVNVARANEVMKKILNDDSYMGEPHIQALCAYVDLCISQNNFVKAFDCFAFCKTTGRPEWSSMAKDLRSRMTLDEDEELKLTRLSET